MPPPCVADDVDFDFSPLTNPAIAMEWTDATGNIYTGQMIIPATMAGSTHGAFPGGSLRWRSLGVDSPGEIDLLVTVSEPASEYSEQLEVEYWSPASSSAPQAVFFENGFACLGFGMRPSICESGATLDATTASCSDGTPTITRAAEFDFSFVRSSTNT